MTDRFENFIAALPPHACELSLTHNQHRSCYETVQQFTEDGPYKPDWISPEQRALAIEHDEVWVLHVYPRTPVGFYAYAAWQLHELLAYARTRDD